MVHVKSKNSIRDRRRFKETAPPLGIANRSHVGLTGTVFKRTVKSWQTGSGETILKDGANNRKIGGDVLVGDLRGAYLATLSLEERATCPTSCKVWDICYGNNMGQARRWNVTPEFYDGLEAELRALCKNQYGVLIRLHVLGDFPDLPYLSFWFDRLTDHHNLFCFGFTAHSPSSKIGNAIAKMRDHFSSTHAIKSRFAIRHSGEAGLWGSITTKSIDCPSETEIVCPEQLDSIDRNARQKHCGSCAVCWQSDKGIRFIEH